MEYAFRSTLTRFLLVFTVLALLAGTVWAQGGSGELTGLVTDPQGAVVSGAEVKLTNPATGNVRTTKTTDAGIYRFVALPIGNYVLEVAPKGFKSVKVQNVVVSVGATATTDVKLELGAATEQVTVEAGQQLVQTEDAALSQLVDRRVWENMPLEARNANDFINLVAGAVPEQQAGGTFRGASVNGTRTGTGNFLVEGVDNNEQGQGGVAICGTACGQGGSNTSITPEAIEEYRVITHGFSAEFGKAGGFVTDTVLKGGTNQFHGSLFEYNRIQALTANDWFSNAGGIRDHLVRNQFGGSIGGPIVKDKTFFFVAVEEHRLRQSQPITGPAITQQFLDFVNTGQLADYVNANFCGGGCPDLPRTLGPLFQQQLARWPLAFPIVNGTADCSAVPTPAECISNDAWGANGAGLLPPYPVPIYGTATEGNVTPFNQLRISIKGDHNLGANDRFNGTYSLENLPFKSNINGASATNFGIPLDNPNRAQTAGITWTHTFSPVLLNQFKIGYNRRTANFIGVDSAGFPSVFTIDPLIGGFGSSAGVPQFFTENRFTYKDDLSFTKGKHQLKFGGEYSRTRNQSVFSNDQFGTFAFWGAEGLVTDGLFTDVLDKDIYGSPYYGGFYYTGASVVPSTGKVPDYHRGYRANEVGIYAQDDWRVNSRLTLNLGLRWDYFGPPHNNVANIDSNVYFGSPVTPIPCTDSTGATVPCSNPFYPQNNPYYALEASGTFQVRNGSIWNKDTNNFAPRFGFSLDTLGNQKLVVRGSFGVFYDRMYNNVFENLRFNAPYFADEVAGVLRSGFAAGPLATPGLYTIPFTPANNALYISPDVFPAGLPKPVPRHIDQDLVTAYYLQDSLGLQYEVAKDWAIEANYVGTMGRKLIGILNRNTFEGRTSGAGSTQRPNKVFNNDNARGNYYGSNYNALNFSVRKQFSHGLSLTANYTYAKALDELSDVFRTKNAANISATDVTNIRNDYGPADFDIRHRVVVAYNYDLPFFKGNRWIGGWTLNGIVSWNTGSPIGLYDGSSDANANGIRSDRPELVKGNSVTDTIISKKGNGTYQYFDGTPFDPVTGIGFWGQSTDCLNNPALDTHGGFWCDPNVSRGSLPGPMFTNVDFGISKAFKISERAKFRFDANFFDLLNHPNFLNPGQDGGGGNNFNSPNFGQSTQTFLDAGGHRVTQLAIRFDF
jgi:hypothetical protein